MMELWPFTNFHDLNLDWIIKTILDWVKKMQNFVTEMTADWQQMEDDWQEFVDSTYKDQITEILEDHPEWVTTVMDGAITSQKINNSFLPEIENAYITPQMYGAVADGTTDDSAAIQTCINAAITDGKAIRFPQAVYSVQSPITISDNIDLDGLGSYIKYDGANTIDAVIIQDIDTDDTFKEKGIIKNLIIDGNVKAARGYYIKRGKGVILENIYVLDASLYGIQIGLHGYGDTWELQARGLYVFGLYTGGLTNCGVYVDRLTDSYVSEVIVTNCSNNWMKCTGYCAGNTFEKVHGYAYPAQYVPTCGITVDGNNNTFHDITIDTFDQLGIEVNQAGNTFTNLTFANPGSTSAVAIRDNSNFNVYDTIYCAQVVDTLLEINGNDTVTIKNLATRANVTHDVTFPNGIPGNLTYDNSGRAVNRISYTIRSSKWIATSGMTTVDATLSNSFAVYKDFNAIGVFGSFTCTAAGSTAVVSTGVQHENTRYIIAFNRTQNKPCLCLWWADGSIHLADAVAANDVLWFDTFIPYG